MSHGTRYSYVQGCRCEACRSANTIYQLGWRASLRRLKKKPPTSGHGLYGWTTFGCRCEVCRDAHRDSKRRAKVNA